MKVENEKNDQGIEIIRVSGRIDPSTSISFEDEINRILTSGATKLVLNLSEVDFISSTGLRVFLTGLKRVKAQKGDLKVCCMNSNVEKLFKLAGFATLFDILPTEEEAVRKFS
jgi:anti-sigma B factor antagonist